MANLFVTLPTTTVNGSGADVDVSGMGGEKTIKVEGSFRGLLSVEISLDGGTTFQPVIQFTDEAARPLAFAADRMRVTRSGIPNGMGSPAPVVTVGANDNGAQFVAVPVPSRPGVGAGVDVSALGSLNTMTLTGPAGGQNGRIVLELSDNNVDWTEIAGMSFGAEGVKTRVFSSQFVRVRREGGPLGGMPPATNVANLGAANDAGAGGGGGSGTGLVFQPGGGGAGPVFFEVWADLMAELTALRAAAGGNLPIEIWFDNRQGAIMIPSGSHEMENVTWRSYRGESDGEFPDQVLITVPNDALLPNLSRLVGPMSVSVDNDTQIHIPLTDGAFVYLQDVEVTGTSGLVGIWGAVVGAGVAGVEFTVQLVRSRFAGTNIVEILSVDQPVVLGVQVDSESTIFDDSLNTVALVEVRGRLLGDIREQPNVGGTVADEFDAGLTWAPRNTDANTNASINELIAADSSLGAIVVNLPQITPFNVGKQVIVKESSGIPTTITVTPTGADTIDGAATHPIVNPFVSRTFVSDGVSNWHVV